MKTLVYTTVLALLLTSMSDAQTTPTTTKKHPLQLESSTITWKGAYLFQVSEHTGTVSFKEGYLLTTNGHVTGGYFVVAMNTITNPIHEEKGYGPVSHLKDPDFFDVAKFPEAILAITKVEYLEEENLHRMHANLTIKGMTKPITFYATVDGNTQQMHTKFKIDRTRWGITYNNKLKDEAISEAIEFDVELQF